MKEPKETGVRSLGLEDLLEEEMATYSSLPRRLHGERSLVDYSHRELDVTQHTDKVFIRHHLNQFGDFNEGFHDQDSSSILSEETELKLAFVFNDYLSFTFYLLEMRGNASFHTWRLWEFLSFPYSHLFCLNGSQVFSNLMSFL